MLSRVWRGVKAPLRMPTIPWGYAGAGLNGARFFAADLDVRWAVDLHFDAPPRTLRLLTRSFPLEIHQYTPWITRGSLKQP